MKRAVISLLEYFATDLSLATNRSFSAEKPVAFVESEFQVDVAASRLASDAGKVRRWQVSLDVKHQPAQDTNFPYSYRIALVGFFEVAESVPPDDEERNVKVHGASVLYGMAREIARAMTGRGPYRPVILPTLSFYESKPRPTEVQVPAPDESTGESAAPAARQRRVKKSSQ